MPTIRYLEGLDFRHEGISFPKYTLDLLGLLCESSIANLLYSICRTTQKAEDTS